MTCILTDVETERRPSSDTRLVWYVAYGSNMHADRMAFYLAGGTHPGGSRTYPGCRDSAPPRRTSPVMIPGGVYFALESRAWTGGLALYDHELSGEAAAQAYLVTASQFSDLAAQEMYRQPGVDLDVFDDVVRLGRLQLGDGRYETLVYTGDLDRAPMITFTAYWHCGDVKPNPPHALYLSRIASGLRESHGWDIDRICAYLADRPGIAGFWAPNDLRAVVGEAL